MEAKDRQIIQQEILRKFPGTDPEIDIDWDIAEISFKAGIREVVEWFSTCVLIEHKDAKNNDIFCRDYRVYAVEWQAKLKEWGID